MEHQCLLFAPAALLRGTLAFEATEIRVDEEQGRELAMAWAGGVGEFEG